MEENVKKEEEIVTKDETPISFETKEQAAKIDVDPAALIDCLTEVDELVNAHVKILESVKKIIKKLVDSGKSHDDAAKIALTLHKRASQKAAKLVPNNLI